MKTEIPDHNLGWAAARYALTVVKTGGQLIKHARYYWLLLTESQLTRRLFLCVNEGVRQLAMAQ